MCVYLMSRIHNPVVTWAQCNMSLAAPNLGCLSQCHYLIAFSNGVNYIGIHFK